MNKFISFGFMVISIILSADSCPSRCFCRQVRKHFHVDCDSPSFSEIKKSIPIRVERTVMMISKVQIFDEFAFDKYRNLRQLYIEAESLLEIHQFTFLNLTQLREIRVGSTKIKTLKANMFHGLSHLHYIEFSHNKRLGSIEENTFTGLPMLDHLSLLDNALISLPQHLFQGLRNLKYIFLEYNKLQTINFTMFSSLPRLSSITAYDNEITNITGNLGKLDELNVIFLQNNRIKEIKKGTFANLKGLSELNLDGNMITSIHHDAFCNTSLINSLRLNHNRLTSIDQRLFQNLTNLRALYLNNNDLQSIHHNTFAHQTKLEELFLNENKLKKIDKDIFRSFRNISRLDLKGNMLELIPYIELTKMKYLVSLDLSHNQIPCTCFYLRILKTLNISDINTDCVLKRVIYEISNQTCKFINKKLKMNGVVVRNNTMNPFSHRSFGNEFMVIMKFRVKRFSKKKQILRITNWDCLNKKQGSLLSNETFAPNKTGIDKTGTASSNSRFQFLGKEDIHTEDDNDTCNIILIAYDKKAIEIQIQRDKVLRYVFRADIEYSNWNTLEMRETLIKNGSSQIEVFNNGKLLLEEIVEQRRIIKEAGLVLMNNSYVEVKTLAIYTSKINKIWMNDVQSRRVLLLTSVIFFVLLLAVVFLISLKTCCKRHQV